MAAQPSSVLHTAYGRIAGWYRDAEDPAKHGVGSGMGAVQVLLMSTLVREMRLGFLHILLLRLPMGGCINSVLGS